LGNSNIGYILKSPSFIGANSLGAA